MEDQHKAPAFANMWLICGIGLVVILSILIGITAKERGWGDYLRLIRKGSNCQAVIIKAEPAGRCEYAFSIGGRSYVGTESECNARVGQKVTITYLVADPSQSCLGHAGERLANEVVSFLFGGLSFPSLS
ncbi:MAG: hypothetical protein A2075_17020 [Geobacteraceae bacterium GWC2_58_44]|nr:MAG: hypothetical protein A2075_17020 [Geobacteraceae bacterium GWC2_58_44]HBG07014.1 hypothetical protein [Geobacter sp.]